MFASRTDWPRIPNRLSQELERRRAAGLPVLDLTESNPTRCGFRFDAQEILSALADPAVLAYEPDPRGPAKAREAVAAYYAEKGARVHPEHIFLTTSTSEAYSYAFRLLANPGENLLVPSPSYPLFDFLAQLNDLELVRYPLVYDHGWRIDLIELERRIARNTRAVLVVHPNNPTGSFVHREEHEALASLCRERSLALIADEVFADFSFAPPPDRLATHTAAGDALTFTLSGLSKISALPQMKLAWIVASGPQEVLTEALARLEIIADTYLSVSAPLAHALPRLLETRRSMQPQILERVRGNLRRLDKLFAAGSPVSRLATEGGWYAILRVPQTRSDEDWALELLRDEGVLLHPGHFYDFPTEGHLVLSLLPQPTVFEAGIRKILARLGH
jgi:aspartate/methionine/tyrosine aminotransferase